MGTFHIIDGNRVKVFYPGNRKTCGRCHQTSDICKGEAIARECEKNGGIRVELTSHMRLLWRKVDFQPSEFNLETENSTADVHIDERRAFSPLITRPTLTEEQLQKMNGLSIKNFPRDLSREAIISFLISKGLPEGFSSSNIAIGKHGNVEVTNLDTEMCHL